MSKEPNLSVKMQRILSGEDKSSMAEMIRNILDYGEKDAKDIMTHRKYIIALDGNETLADTIPFILEQNYSRFPVYEEDIDTIIGTLHLRDVMACYLDEKLRNIPLKDLEEAIRPVQFIPETRNIDKLFQQMRIQKNHMVVVLDEYGQTSGLVTMEDIIEEIMGNIQDEYDEEEESIVEQMNDTYLVQGMTELSDLEEILGITFDVEDCETLNGFLVLCLDHIPSEGENHEVEYKGYHFRVMSVDDNMIQSVEIKKLDETNKE